MRENQNEVKQIGHTCPCDRWCFTAFDAPSSFIPSEEAKKGKKKKKESDKPDTVTEDKQYSLRWKNEIRGSPKVLVGLEKSKDES